MSLPLHILTIVLDGWPFLPMQLACFNRLKCNWTWHIVEGPAANVNCTSWCKPQEPRFSTDGSHEFLLNLRDHPRCDVVCQRWWRGGKVEMCNHGISGITEPCVLLQVDVDELWLPSQIDYLVDEFAVGNPVDIARFYCRYFVGMNIVTVGEDCYGNNPGEWTRAWRFTPGMSFSKHEPPVLVGGPLARGGMTREETLQMGLVFDHWAYVFESQVAYKEKFYGYTNAVKGWRQLQSHPGPWPVRLRDFLPWVSEHSQADLLHKP